MKSARIALIAALVALAGNVILVGALLGVRSIADARLHGVASILRQVAGDSITTTIHMRQPMEMRATIQIVKPTGIDLNLDVHDKLPVQLRVKVDDKLKVPVDLNIDEAVKVDRAVMAADRTKIRARADIKIKQPIQWRVASPLRPLLNIEGSVPLDHEMDVEFPESLRISGTIPVKLNVRETIDVPVNLDVPVDQMMDLNLAIKQRAIVGFPEPLEITGTIPVVIDIPVEIPLAETPIGPALVGIADGLEKLLAP